ncbi:hypothetical protein DFS34DRAFT_582186 [Phlyctochytrium arcticum]|nr:hypothetical protein DFS34DRAFT_582186 [Phlyctochytrium arcticum]
MPEAERRQELLDHPAQSTDGPSTKSRVGYVYSAALRHAADCLPSNRNRSTYVHSLIDACNLFRHLHIIDPIEPSIKDFTSFHTRAYNEHLPRTIYRTIDDGRLPSDCPVFDELPSYVKLVTGGTLAAARALVEGSVHTAFHWDGGSPDIHFLSCIRESASGFCYVNDIVIGIFELQKKFSRILYLDLDIHHGDGVENAFQFSPRVYTCSIHRFDPGFFPASGRKEFSGLGKGRHHVLNIPMKRGLRGESFLSCVQAVLEEVMRNFAPECVVLQCGADGAIGNLNSGDVDTNGQRHRDASGEGWNIGPAFFGDLITCVNAHRGFCPLLVLGGGGYVNTITARCWAAATATSVGIRFDQEDIPDHALWTHYARDVISSPQRDENETDLASVIEFVRAAIRKVPALSLEGAP